MLPSSSSVIPLREVLRRTSLSERTLWRYVACGLFPRPIRLGPGRVGWLEAEVDAWIAGCAGQLDKHVAQRQRHVCDGSEKHRGLHFKTDLEEATRALLNGQFSVAAHSCSRLAERLIAAQGDRNPDTLAVLLRTLGEKLHALDAKEARSGTAPRNPTARVGAPRKHDLSAISAFVKERRRQDPDLKRESIIHEAAARFRCSTSTVHRALRKNQAQ